MKRQAEQLSAAMAVAMAMTTGAHAATFDLDYTGFTVNFNGSSSWSEAAKGFDTSATALSFSELGTPTTGYVVQSLGGGVKFNDGAATFNSTGTQSVQSYGGLGNQSASSWFSYTVQAKPGWQLSYVAASGYVGGDFAEFAGGKTSATGGASLSSVGGDPLNGHDGGASFYRLQQSAGPITLGAWSEQILQSANGNALTSDYQAKFGANGEWNGYTLSFNVTKGLAPMTSVTGSVAANLQASTTGFPQISYMSGGPGTFGIYARAVQSVSPVPEPSSYAMLIATLGMLGFLARRKSR